MPGITAAEALAQIQNLTTPTVQQIRDIVAQVDASVPNGQTAIFNSGPIVTGTTSYDAVNALKAADSSLASIGDTQMTDVIAA